MSDWGSTEYQDSDYLENIKPEWLWLAVGYSLTLLMLLAALFFRTSGELAWLSYLALWLVSLASCLAPFALFAIKDFDLIAKNPNSHPIGRSNLPFYRTTLLIFGFVVSMIFVYLAAEEISRNLNAVT